MKTRHLCRSRRSRIRMFFPEGATCLATVPPPAPLPGRAEQQAAEGEEHHRGNIADDSHHATAHHLLPCLPCPG